MSKAGGVGTGVVTGGNGCRDWAGHWAGAMGVGIGLVTVGNGCRDWAGHWAWHGDKQAGVLQKLLGFCSRIDCWPNYVYFTMSF